MRHLIVEACIARNLIDTSAYFWPGYVSASTISPSDTSPVQKSLWSTFMEGAPLRDALIKSLIRTPVSRYNEKYLNIIVMRADLLLISFSFILLLKFSRGREVISYCIDWV